MTTAGKGPRRVVVSSLTGLPIPWEEPDEADGTDGAETPPGPAVVPDRAAEDTPEPGRDESNDARLSGDVPPHWGR